MPEVFTLTTPIVPASRTTYTVNRLLLDWSNQQIKVWLLGSDGVEIYNEWDGPQATALMTALNSANFSTTSLYKNILLQLVAAGKLAPGIVAGTPS